MLASPLTSASPTWNGSLSAATIRVAISSISAGSSTSSISAANSSPPSRAALSGWPERFAEPLPDGHQQLVAGVVTHGVVDHLEVVEVDEQHADDAALAPGPGHRTADPLLEQHPVGQAGQRVVERAVRQLLFEPAAFGDVAQRDHDAPDGLIVPQVLRERLDLDERPVGVPHAPVGAGLARLAAAAGADEFEQLGGVATVVRVEELS